MKSVTEDTDEECWDDPIRLFDCDGTDINLGSRPQEHGSNTVNGLQSEKANNEELIQVSDSTLGKSNVYETNEEILTISNSECKIRESFVKLVDCGKFPWYYRKYTQQILSKTTLKLDCDSDIEIDVVGTDSDMDDCVIIEDAEHVSKTVIKDKQSISVFRTKIKFKTAVEKRLETMKRREDLEIKKALELRNKSTIDLKRNQGLVGMRIARKVSQTGTLVNTINKTNKTKKITDKVITNIGTEFITISDQSDKSNIKDKYICNTNLGTKKIIESIPKKLLAHCRLDRISQQLLKKVKVTQRQSKYSNLLLKAKIQQIQHNRSLLNNNIEVISNNSSLPASHSNTDTTMTSVIFSKDSFCIPPSTSSSLHVKDIRKTNKFKNDQTKLKNNCEYNTFMQLLKPKPKNVDTKTSTTIKELKNEVKDVKQMKKIESAKISQKIKSPKRNLNSPILPSRILPKKTKESNESTPKSSQSHANASNNITNLNNIVDKLKNTDNLTISHRNDHKKVEISKKSILKINPPKQIIVDDILKNKIVKQNDCVITHLPDKNNRKTNAHNKPKTNTNTNHHDKIQFPQNIIASNSNSLDNLSQQFAPAVNSNKYNKSNTAQTNKKEPTTSLITPISNSKTVNGSDHLSNSSRSQSITKPHKSNSMSDLNNKNNSFVHNRYASSIILKPNQQIPLPVSTTQVEVPNAGDYSEKGTNYQKSGNLPIPVITHTRNQNSHGYYQPFYSDRYADYLSRSVTTHVQNPLPQDICQQVNTLRNNQVIYKSWLPKKLGMPVTKINTPPAVAVSLSTVPITAAAPLPTNAACSSRDTILSTKVVVSSSSGAGLLSGEDYLPSDAGHRSSEPGHLSGAGHLVAGARQLPSGAVHFPSNAGHPSSDAGHPSSDAGHPPSVVGHPPSVAGHPPSVAGHPPSVAGQPPSVAGHPPSVAGHPSSVAGHPPSGVGHTQLSVGHNSSSVGHTPSNVEHTQSGIELTPSGKAYPPSGVGHPQSGAGHPQSGIGPHQSGVGHHQSGVGHHQSGVGHPQSGVGHPQSGVGHSSSGVGHPQSGVAHPQSGVGISSSGVGLLSLDAGRPPLSTEHLPPDAGLPSSGAKHPGYLPSGAGLPSSGAKHPGYLPSGAGHRPSVIMHPPPVTMRPSSTAMHPPPVALRPPLVSVRPSLAAIRQPTVAVRPPKIIAQPSMRPPPIVNRPPMTAVRQLSMPTPTIAASTHAGPRLSSATAIPLPRFPVPPRIFSVTPSSILPSHSSTISGHAPSLDVPSSRTQSINNKEHLTQMPLEAYKNLSVSTSLPISSSQIYSNLSQEKDSSIIGINNDGLVKKINIMSKPVPNTAEVVVKVEPVTYDAQIETTQKDSTVVRTKTEMMQELNRMSFSDEESNTTLNVIKNAKIATEAQMEEAKSNSRKLDVKVTHEGVNKQTEQQKGYSAPILPIPTYEKLHQAIAESQRLHERLINTLLVDGNKNKKEMKQDTTKKVEKGCKRKLSQVIDRLEEGRKADAKKISLEEYKKRGPKSENKAIAKKNLNKNNAKNRNGRQRRKINNDVNMDCSTETDLGYDSDSTVIL